MPRDHVLIAIFPGFVVRFIANVRQWYVRFVARPHESRRGNMRYSFWKPPPGRTPESYTEGGEQREVDRNYGNFQVGYIVMPDVLLRFSMSISCQRRIPLAPNTPAPDFRTQVQSGDLLGSMISDQVRDQICLVNAFSGSKITK